MKISLFVTIRRDQNGSLFIGLIITMMLFAALGAAMFSFTTTSAFNQVWVNSSSKAYYLAESGFRYVKAEYEDTKDGDEPPEGDIKDGEIQDDRNEILESWHGQIFTFITNYKKNEKFELNIYPYYLVTSASHSAGVTSLQTKFSGAKPSNFTVPSSGKLKIGSDPVYSYSNYVSTTGVFTISPGLKSAVSDNMDVRLIANANPASGESPVTNGGNLTLADASLFPEYNGIFSIDRGTGTGDTAVYAYKSNSGNQLKNIYDVINTDRTFSVPISSGTDIVLEPFFQLNAIGIVEHGSNMETKRELTYSIPVYTTQKREFVETDWGSPGDTQNFPHWQNSDKGAHEVQSITGNQVLKVTGTSDLGSGDAGSSIGFKWSTTGIDLGLIHELSGDYLSYDVQVKTGFTPSVPNYFMPGISFRLSAAGNYGASFVRSGTSDGIPADLVQVCDESDPTVCSEIKDIPMIALWQQNNSPSVQRKWLAHKVLLSPPFYFSDNMESGTNGWTVVPGCSACAVCSGFWNMTDNRHTSSSNSWYYGQQTNWDYNNGDRNCGSLVSPAIDLTTATGAYLTFWSWYETESRNNLSWVNTYDVKYVDIHNGTSWVNIDQITYPDHPMKTWMPVQINLSAYVGNTIRIRFRFDTLDSSYNDHEGWYIDNVTVTATNTFPVNEATLAVRLTEGAALKFTGGGTTAIKDGDLVIQGTGRGTVVGDPILESGSWAGGDASGTIILKKVSGTFQGGQDMYVGSSALATISSDPGFFRARDNYIKVYHGNTSGYGTPDSQWLNHEKHANPRGETHWPPEKVSDWAADNDYFTLVQWDVVNSSLSSVASVDSIDEPDAIIRTNALTTTTGTFSDTEIGLHTFGAGSYSTSVYFDDFAIQAEFPIPTGFLPAVQQ